MKSLTRLFKSALEYGELAEIQALRGKALRGIYVLYKKKGSNYNVVYIGMSGRDSKGRIEQRLKIHSRSFVKDWTHFSCYEVWDNVSDFEIREIEGLLRQIYRFDESANMHNVQITHKPLIKLRRETEKALGLPRMNKGRLGI